MSFGVTSLVADGSWRIHGVFRDTEGDRFILRGSSHSRKIHRKITFVSASSGGRCSSAFRPALTVRAGIRMADGRKKDSHEGASG